MVLKKMSYCVQHVFLKRKKGNPALLSKKEDAFLSTSCSNWKNALEKFRKHCHLKASIMSVIREIHENIGEMFNDTLNQIKKLSTVRVLKKGKDYP